MKRYFLFVLGCLVMLNFSSCKPEEESVGSITLNFKFDVDGEELLRDTLLYVNDAGNRYMVTDLQLIISKLSLTRSDGALYEISDAVHYIDFVDESTLCWHIDSIPNGVYNEIGFTFGLDTTMNISGAYPNPPISDMFWPEHLGGGYHFMKLNCKWLYQNELLPLNFHLGVAEEQMPFATVRNKLFVNNSFTVTDSLAYEVSSQFVNAFDVSMNVNNWFGPENVIDFDVIKDVFIMESQAVQFQAKLNGKNVFTISKND